MSAKRNNSPAVEKPMETAVNGTQHAANAEPMTLEAVRRELKGVKGKKYWRSLDELANTAEFQAAVEREFPSAAQEWVDPVSRRGFLEIDGRVDGAGRPGRLHQAA